MGIDCLSNFVVQITPTFVNGVNCFAEKYDGTTVMDLIIGSGNDRCTAADSSSQAADDTYFFSSVTLDQPVSADSTSIFFSVFDCGIQSQVIYTENGNYKEFSTTMRSDFRNIGFMILGPAFGSTPISCRYKHDDTNIGIDIVPAIDASRLNDQNSVLQNAESAEISSDLVSYTVLVDGQEYSTTSDVILGTSVSIRFDSIGSFIDGFHIASCFATNEISDESSENYESLYLIKNSCKVTSGHLALPSIDPQVNDRTLSYSQFAFFDDAMNLSFDLQCTLKFGDQPSCSSGSSRSFDEDSVKVKIPITVDYDRLADSAISPLLTSSLALSHLLF